jgi:hypothetical protein
VRIRAFKIEMSDGGIGIKRRELESKLLSIRELLREAYRVNSEKPGSRGK